MDIFLSLQPIAPADELVIIIRHQNAYMVIPNHKLILKNVLGS